MEKINKNSKIVKGFFLVFLILIIEFCIFYFGYTYGRFKSSKSVQEIGQQDTQLKKDTFKSSWKIYRNHRYYFSFFYPENFLVREITDFKKCAEFYSFGKEKPCLVNLKIYPTNIPKEFFPAIRFYLLKDIKNVKFSGQTDDIKFDATSNNWILVSPFRKKILSIFGRAMSGQRIFLGENGGSQAESYYYIIPDKQRDLVAVFIVPKLFRLYCDIFTEINEKDIEKKLRCKRFYNELIHKYGKEETDNGWLPAEYIKQVYQPAEEMIKSFQLY